MSAIEYPKQYCGEVFITNNYLMMLECKYCSEQFVSYEKFLNHIFDKHFDNIDEYQSGIEDDDMDILNVQEIDGGSEEQHTTDYTDSKKSEQSTEISTTKTRKDAKAPIAKDIKRKDPNHQSKAAVSNIRSVGKKIRMIKKKEVERKYKCKFCDDAFYSASILTKHEQRHSNNKPYSCTQCCKRFFTRTELNTHIRWHTGERPFVCTYCGNCYTTSSALTTHEKRHNDERKYKCEQCEKSYFTGFMLRQHLSVHTGERNFKCNFCANTFTRITSLRNHMKLHENALRYECNICQMRFNQKPTLIWHKKSKHDIVTNAGAEAGNISLMQQTNKTTPDTENVLQINDKQLSNNSVHALEEAESEIIEDFLRS